MDRTPRESREERLRRAFLDVEAQARLVASLALGNAAHRAAVEVLLQQRDGLHNRVEAHAMMGDLERLLGGHGSRH